VQDLTPLGSQRALFPHFRAFYLAISIYCGFLKGKQHIDAMKFIDEELADTICNSLFVTIKFACMPFNGDSQISWRKPPQFYSKSSKLENTCSACPCIALSLW